MIVIKAKYVSMWHIKEYRVDKTTDKPTNSIAEYNAIAYDTGTQAQAQLTFDRGVIIFFPKITRNFRAGRLLGVFSEIWK